MKIKPTKKIIICIGLANNFKRSLVARVFDLRRSLYNLNKWGKTFDIFHIYLSQIFTYKWKKIYMTLHSFKGEVIKKFTYYQKKNKSNKTNEVVV